MVLVKRIKFQILGVKKVKSQWPTFIRILDSNSLGERLTGVIVLCSLGKTLYSHSASLHPEENTWANLLLFNLVLTRS